MVRYIGIDPGLSGACAVIECADDVNVTNVVIHDTPTLTVKKNKTNRREYQASLMASNLDKYRWHTLKEFPNGVVGMATRYRAIQMAVIESVHAMPGNGSIGNFGMGMGMGLWVGILATHAIPYTCVPAPTWKKALGVNKEKAGCILRAQQMFPQVADQLTRKKDDGRAEALLLAEYARRMFGNHTVAVAV